MSIWFNSIEVRDPLRGIKKVSKEWIKAIIKEENRKLGAVNFVFCTDDYLLKMNKEFLNRNYLTDVISFDLKQENEISGDIFISIERIQENAKKYGVTFLEELIRVMAHGLLHLIGYNDQNAEEKRDMSLKEDYYLDRMKRIVEM